MKKKLIIATGNAGKAREFAALFPAYEVLSMKEAGFTGAIEETGDTFYENALIKARWETAFFSSSVASPKDFFRSYE